MRVMVNQYIGNFQNPTGGAVVLLQFDQTQTRKVFLEFGQVLRTGTAPGVDGLIIVTHYRQGTAHPHQLLNQAVLRQVGILILIHQQVVNAALPTL